MILCICPVMVSANLCDCFPAVISGLIRRPFICPGQPWAMACLSAVALSTEIPGIDAIDSPDVSCCDEVNRLVVEQFNQLAITDIVWDSKQRQPVLFDTVCRNSANLRNQCRGRSRSRASRMARQPSSAVSPSPTGGTILAPKVESIGGGCAATASPGVETTAVEMEEKINISDDLEVTTVTGIRDNHGVSSSTEPSTVGAGIVLSSSVPTTV